MRHCASMVYFQPEEPVELRDLRKSANLDSCVIEFDLSFGHVQFHFPIAATRLRRI